MIPQNHAYHLAADNADEQDDYVPERDLLAAIIKQAQQDCVAPKTYHKKSLVGVVEQARWWLFQDKEDRAPLACQRVSFRWCCEALGWNAHVTRLRIAEEIYGASTNFNLGP